MRNLARVPLDGGGAILFEADPDLTGPVKAGRVGEAVRDLPHTLRGALAPVRDTARTVLEQLREAGPDEVEVEFGVDLSAEAGVVVTKSQAAVHLKVRVLWRSGEPTTGDAG
ncbi:CU044_2847 family protein [Streptomyces litchfieldiae]|uniref:CU044_2847 family protein n=1 Tax=Streptomyces litchfieldiae TaxID=3075543 RepID=A0ABU2MP42_9ACTN|nr:CU044_2847 family protein [Streptomyces sp. DSM 44938]MDT0343275.1 CU044_2847 family protein [Streptomyces sp. DSM 44938]